MSSYHEILDFIRHLYPGANVQLHEPRFVGNEKKYLSDCVDSTFVSSIGKYVTDFEKKIADFTGVKHAIATTNGTSALHLALVAAGVQNEDEVITQAVTFIATVNSIAYCSAHPVFIDSDFSSLGMDPVSLQEFLETKTEIRNDGLCYNKKTNRIIRACLPMHVLGHALHMKEIARLCQKHHIVLIEDAAEALGTRIEDKHVGHHGLMSTLSFNGNKVITCGGGGMILTNDDQLAKRLKHLSTTAKVPHPWEFNHDEVGYNYRLPNINAALACAQMENLEKFLDSKREVAKAYAEFFKSQGVPFITEREGTRSNYWLNAILLKNAEEKNEFLKTSHAQGIFTRPLWTLMPKLPMFKHAEKTSLKVAEDLADRLVCLPSSVRL